jgi:hypothetical protein
MADIEKGLPAVNYVSSIKIIKLPEKNGNKLILKA